MTPPAKKATPAKEPVVVTLDKPVEEPVVEDDSVVVAADKDHVHTWEEDHDQNLARLQKDVIAAGPPSESAQVAVTGYVTDYAGENENDDKGRADVAQPKDEDSDNEDE